jgi:hypothetical protein
MKSIIKVTAGTAGGVLALLTTLVSPVLASGSDYWWTGSDIESQVASTAIIGGGMSIAVIISICCGFIFYFGIDILLAFLVYRDAQKNKVDNAVLWAILTLFFNLVIILVYFLAIRPEAIRKLEATTKTETK